MRNPRHFVVYNPKFVGVRDKMTGTETLHEMLCSIYYK